MASRIEVDDSWHEHVTVSVERFFDERLGPDIAGDAHRYCPKRSGALAESIEHHIEGGDLIVSATGSDEKSYAAYVELGTHEHEVKASTKQALFWEGARHPVRKVTIPDIPAQPFLRPALYQQRSE